jgi:predicted ester cyclase
VATLQRKNVGTPRGTHHGAFQGIPPTGKPVTLTGISIWRVDGGKIVESWHELDTLGLMQQLDVIPTPGQAG